MKEYILCSAVWFKDYTAESFISEVVKEQSRPVNTEKGVVICGFRHLQCLRTFTHMTGKRAVESVVGKSTQVFLTNTNRFVDRTEGGEIAFKAGQTEILKTTLYSEDLW